MLDRRKSNIMDEGREQEARLTATNVGFCLMFQEVVFKSWWAQSEGNRDIGLGARFLFTFASPGIPGGPKLGNFGAEVFSLW